MSEFFENVYKNINNDNYNNIPWATLNANIYLKEYLKDKKTVENKTALVIGCGLGDDASALEYAGYKVDAIDISNSAISHAKKRFPSENINFMVQDIFNLPQNMTNKYDFIYEGLTIQSINPKFRNNLIDIISSLNKKDGELLLYTHIQNDEHNFGGPPWPLYRNELELFTKNNHIELHYKEEQNQTKAIAPYKSISLFKKIN